MAQQEAGSGTASQVAGDQRADSRWGNAFSLLPAPQVRNTIEGMIQSGVLVGDMATGWNARLKEKEEVTEVRCRAETGDGLAQLALAVCYHMGLLGIVQDAAKKAFKWFKRAADNNQACNTDVGLLLRKRQGRQKELESRVDVLRKGRGIGRVSLLFRIGHLL